MCHFRHILFLGCSSDTAIYRQIEEAEKNVSNSPKTAASIIDSLTIDYNQLNKEWQARLVLRKRRTRIREKMNISLVNSNLHIYLINHLF
jgi:hypothetical protein